MKTLLASLVLVSVAQAQPIDVHILAGQSNALPRTHEVQQGEFLYRGYNRIGGGVGEPDPNFQPYSVTKFGPEATLGPLLNGALIQFTYGGTSLSTKWHPEATTDLMLYQQMLGFVNQSLGQLVADGYEPDVKGFFWVQGEADAGTVNASSAYLDNLNLLISYVEADLGVETFVASLVHVDSLMTYTNVVRQAQLDSNALIVSVDDQPLNNDLVHHSTAAQLTNGQRLANAYLGATLGDWDGNGITDGRDFLVWQRGPKPKALDAWETNYGSAMVTPLAATSAAVPEPTTLLLAALASMGLLVRRR